MRIFTDVAVLLHTVPAAEAIRIRLTKHFDNLRFRPYVKRAFPFFVWMRGIDHAVGILGGIKAALRMSHVALYVTKDIAGYLCQRFIARNLKPFQIGNRKLSLIVEHLFKVRNEPLRVHGVAMESAG